MGKGLRPEWTLLEETIRLGAEWLVHSRQPPKAGIHGGEGTHVGGTLYVSFDPWGHFTKRKKGSIYSGPEPSPVNMRTRGYATVIFTMANNEWLDTTVDPWREGPPVAPFTADEIAAFRALLDATDLHVDDQWNGVGLHTASFGVNNAHPSLKRAASNYMDGCPDHGSVFCYQDGCDWYYRIHKALAVPTWPVAPYPEPDGGGTNNSDDDRNLAAVRDALARLVPLLAEMGVHPATVVAGRRGHIDEQADGRLRFDADVGHGILIPAETALGLVALAAAAQEAGLAEPEPRSD